MKCGQCSKTHKLLITSDEQELVEGQVDLLCKGLRMAGLPYQSAVVESWHPGTDLSVREWDDVERLLDELSIANLPF